MAKIAFINLWSKGGMRHYSDALIGILAKEHEVLYCTNEATQLPCEHLILPISLNPLDIRNSSSMVRLMKKLASFKPDVVHLNSGHPMLLVVYPLFALFHSVITIHDAVPHEGEKRLKVIVHAIQLRCFSLFFKKIIVHSEKIKDQLPGYMDRKKVFVMPIVNLGFLAEGKTMPQKTDQRFTVLFFGRILEYKGLDYLLEAFKQLDPSKYKLIVAGEGRVSGEVQRDRVELMDRFIGDEELPAIFGSADIVALPYISASQSGVAHLAFAFERPVIATDVGALTEVVHHGVNGLIVPPRSAEALVEAIRMLEDAGIRAKMIEAIRTQRLGEDQEIGNLLNKTYQARV